MQCPNCGATAADPEATFCSRCGQPLSSEETEATARLDVPAVEETSDLRADTAPDTHQPAPLLADYTDVLRKKFLTSWLDPIGAACLAFLVLLAVGAVLLVAAKLQYPGFGAGANPVEILSSVSILGLAILRVPVHVDDLVVSVLPMGALLAAGAGIAWSTTVTTKDRDPRSLRDGAAVGIPFGIICFIAALVFRFGGKSEVFAGAIGALFWGLVWGSAFGALAVFVRNRPRRNAWSIVAELGRGSSVQRAVAAAAIGLATAALLAGAAMLLWVIVALVRGAPGPNFGAGDAVAAFVYLLAFGPNVLVTLIALGTGAPVYVGARVTVEGAGVGNVERIWLFGDAPGYVGFLILIPLVACSLAGFWLRRTSSSSSTLELPIFGGFFAAVLALVAWLGEARLGASLLGRGFARLDVNAPALLAFAFLWAVAAGYFGWWLADRADSPEGKS